MYFDISLLPVELIIQIIEHTHEDPSAIKACSLVCKAWHPIAHSILFNRITIPLFQQPVSIDHANSRVEPITDHVHDVWALCLKGPAIWQTPFANRSKHSIALTTLIAVTQKFPNLRELVLYGFEFDSEGLLPATLHEIIPTFAPRDSLKTIKLETPSLKIDQNMPNLFVYLFTLFPTVQHFIYRETWSVVYPERVTADPSGITLTEVVSSLRTLSCYLTVRRNISGFVDIIRPFVKSVETIDFYKGTCADFNTLICGLQENLESLKTVRLTSNISRRNWDTHSLLKLSTLRTIHVAITHGFKPYLPLFPTLPNSLRTLTFELSWRPDEVDGFETFLDGLVPSHFDECIARGLEKVVFMPHHPGQELKQSMQRVIRTRLSGLDGRGTLHIDRFCRRIEGCWYDKALYRFDRIVK